MFTTAEALAGWPKDEYGPYFMAGEYEIRLEPLLYDKQFYLAIYKNQDLVVPKVVMKPGFDRDELLKTIDEDK